MGKNIKQTRSDLRKAQRKLDELGKRQKKAGIKYETAEYHRLNGQVNRLANTLPWYAR